MPHRHDLRGAIIAAGEKGLPQHFKRQTGGAGVMVSSALSPNKLRNRDEFDHSAAVMSSVSTKIQIKISLNDGGGTEAHFLECCSMIIRFATWPHAGTRSREKGRTSCPRLSAVVCGGGDMGD